MKKVVCGSREQCTGPTKMQTPEVSECFIAIQTLTKYRKRKKKRKKSDFSEANLK